MLKTILAIIGINFLIEHPIVAALVVGFLIFCVYAYFQQKKQAAGESKITAQRTIFDCMNDRATFEDYTKNLDNNERAELAQLTAKMLEEKKKNPDVAAERLLSYSEKKRWESLISRCS